MNNTNTNFEIDDVEYITAFSLLTGLWLCCYKINKQFAKI